MKEIEISLTKEQLDDLTNLYMTTEVYEGVTIRIFCIPDECVVERTEEEVQLIRLHNYNGTKQ